MKQPRRIALLGASFLFGLLYSHPGYAAGQVYLVVGSDTALWNYPSNAPNTVDSYQFASYYQPDLLVATNSASYLVMDPAFRSRLADSFGQPLKLTWWVMGGNVFRYASNLNVPIANTMTLRLMKQYHGDAIRQLGDEVSLHYHTFAWTDPNHDGVFHWNQTATFLECKDDFDYTLEQYLLEEEVFPVSFRSGWHFMDNDWQAYLNQLLPYNLDDDYGVRHVWSPNPEPVAGVEDWSRAPANFIPFHPASTNYQVPGDGNGWNVRSVKMQSLTSGIMDGIFSAAAAGTDQVACLWSHLPEDFVNQVIRTDALAHGIASNYPTVSFRYCTAVEAMQRWRGLTNPVPPELAVTDTTEGDITTLTLQTSVPIWQPQPFVTTKDVWQQYQILLCTNTAANTWSVTLPQPKRFIAKVGMAVTDRAGNLTTRILRYLPDDVYVDNLDSGYQEMAGNWTRQSTTAWGIDSRKAFLGSDDVARVQWQLPVTHAGRYQLSIQIPAVTNSARHLNFSVHADGSNVFSASTSSPIPPFQWYALGAPYLDSTASNVLEMLVSGTNQAGSWAVADVLKIAYVPDTNAPAIVCSSNLFAQCDGTNGIAVPFEVSAIDDYDPRPVVSCAPSSDTIFPIGLTTVLCTATDHSGNRSQCSFTVTVVDTNRVPVAATFAIAASENTPLSIPVSEILSHDYDPDGDPLTFATADQSAQGGSASLINGETLLFIPPANFRGRDSLAYTIEDGHGASATSTVEIEVLEGPLPNSNELLIRPATNGCVVRFSGPAGAACQVERSGDLETWEVLDTMQVPVYGILEYLDRQPPAEAAYYRIAITVSLVRPVNSSSASK